MDFSHLAQSLRRIHVDQDKRVREWGGSGGRFRRRTVFGRRDYVWAHQAVTERRSTRDVSNDRWQWSLSVWTSPGRRERRARHWCIVEIDFNISTRVCACRPVATGHCRRPTQFRAPSTPRTVTISCRTFVVMTFSDSASALLCSWSRATTPAA